jgi:hypothetical protein
MKYMLSWTNRAGGSASQLEEDAKRALQMYQKWTPPSGLNILAWVGRVDGEGGYALVETDDPSLIAGIPAKFATYLITTVHPVLEMADMAQIAGEGIEWRGSL